MKKFYVLFTSLNEGEGLHIEDTTVVAATHGDALSQAIQLHKDIRVEQALLAVVIDNDKAKFLERLAKN